MRKPLYALAMAATLGVFAADLLLLGVPAVREGWWTLAFFALPASCLVLARGAKERTRLQVAAVALLVLGVAGYVAMRLGTGNVSGTPSVRVGERAPGFSLKDAEGREAGLDGFVGQGRVVLVFFRGKG